MHHTYIGGLSILVCVDENVSPAFFVLLKLPRSAYRWHPNGLALVSAPRYLLLGGSSDAMGLFLEKERRSKEKRGISMSGKLEAAEAAFNAISQLSFFFP